ncbi:Carbonic anhydrase [uncultured Dysgonomonas sp.]|uniref:carbonic anhydrase n=2 Tax=uncultured Dysgonomonas sp. TaxID=206096 RepID=A0A212J1W9_9BACT|nr:Carbonic anhydrase [uncultured Dysgonomonas sp.]
MKPSYFSKHVLLMTIFSLSTVISYAQDQMSEDALTALKDGNKRFCSGQLLHNHQDLTRIEELKTGQKPFAIVVSCSDSRVTPEIVFDQGLGDIFSIRTAGNVMADYEEGSIEYAAEHLGTKLIVVMGHTSCGAVKAFMDIKHSHENHDAHHTEKLGHIESIIKKLDSEEEENEVFKTEGDVYNRAIIANVIHGVKQLRKSEPFLKEMNEEGDVKIVGAIYHIESGEVEFLDI